MKSLKMAAAALLVGAFLTGCGDSNDNDFVVTGNTAVAGANTATYRVTITNLTGGQPFSPPIAATHSANAANIMFEIGQPATTQLAAIAQDGDQGPMATLLAGNANVTEVANPGVPLTFAGNTVDLGNGVTATDTLTFDIVAAPGDVFSLASMLIATNDGSSA